MIHIIITMRICCLAKHLTSRSKPIRRSLARRQSTWIRSVSLRVFFSKTFSNWHYRWYIAFYCVILENKKTFVCVVALKSPYSCLCYTFDILHANKCGTTFLSSARKPPKKDNAFGSGSAQELARRIASDLSSYMLVLMYRSLLIVHHRTSYCIAGLASSVFWSLLLVVKFHATWSHNHPWHRNLKEDGWWMMRDDVNPKSWLQHLIILNRDLLSFWKSQCPRLETIGKLAQKTSPWPLCSAKTTVT